MRQLVIAAGIAALTLAASGATAAAASAHLAHHKPCATLNVGFRVHGMEADAPVRICGLKSSRATYNCSVKKGTFGDPNERWACTEARK